MSKLHAIAVVLAFLLLSAVVVAPAFAAAPQPAMPAFGSVDVDRAFAASERKKAVSSELDTYGRQLQSNLELREANKLLSEQELAQVRDLKAKASLTAAEQSNVESLLAKSRELDKEFAALQQKPNPTAEESARLKELQSMVEAGKTALTREQEKYSADFSKRQSDLLKQAIDDIDAAVAAVAKGKGLSIVFNKSVGQLNIVVYSSVDITDDVIKKLNKT